MKKMENRRYETPVTRKLEIVVESALMAASDRPLEPTGGTTIAQQEGYDNPFEPGSWD